MGSILIMVVMCGGVILLVYGHTVFEEKRAHAREQSSAHQRMLAAGLDADVISERLGLSLQRDGGAYVWRDGPFVLALGASSVPRLTWIRHVDTPRELGCREYSSELWFGDVWKVIHPEAWSPIVYIFPELSGARKGLVRLSIEEGNATLVFELPDDSALEHAARWLPVIQQVLTSWRESDAQSIWARIASSLRTSALGGADEALYQLLEYDHMEILDDVPIERVLAALGTSRLITDSWEREVLEALELDERSLLIAELATPLRLEMLSLLSRRGASIGDVDEIAVVLHRNQAEMYDAHLVDAPLLLDKLGALEPNERLVLAAATPRWRAVKDPLTVHYGPALIRHRVEVAALLRGSTRGALERMFVRTFIRDLARELVARPGLFEDEDEAALELAMKVFEFFDADEHEQQHVRKLLMMPTKDERMEMRRARVAGALSVVDDFGAQGGLEMTQDTRGALSEAEKES